MKITVVGLGYVGLATAMLLSQFNEVIGLDSSKDKIKKLKNKVSPIRDPQIEEFLAKKNINFKPTLNKEISYKDAEVIIIATPTNYDPINNTFDTSSVESVVKDVLSTNKNSLIIIKSTVPIGFTNMLSKSLSCKNIIFSPEFSQEGSSLYDNLFPSRIIIGEKSDRAVNFSNILIEGAYKKDVDILYTHSTEAEAIKLFSNTYLAMRISFFNELDTFANINNLDTKSIIDGVSLDPRIGHHYNNPSFGYGGYCLPKDTKQLKANYRDIKNSDIISAIVKSNETRKEFIANSIINLKPSIIGIYRLIMKTGSDNFRSSAINDVIEILKSKDQKIIIYEPNVIDESINGLKVVNDLKEFKKISSIIIANRMAQSLNDVSNKVFTRDIFNEG